MNKNILTSGICICALLVMVACQKKDQDFVFEKLNEVSIIPQNDTLIATQFDHLKETPTLTETKPGSSSFNYQWKIYPEYSSTSDAVILSTKRDLDVNIELPPNTYKLQYKVTNAETGVASFHVYTVIVNGKFYEGWLISNNKGGNAQLSFLRADDTLFLNPAEQFYNTVYKGKAISAFAGIGLNMALIYFFTDNGLYRFNANDLFQISSTKDIFPSGKTFSGFSMYGTNDALYDQYIITGGGLYAGFGPSWYLSELLKPFSERFTGDYDLFPGIISSQYSSSYFYDNKYKRFMNAGGLDRTLTPSIGSNTATFNIGNVGKTLIAIDYGTRAYNQDEFYLVMKDDLNNRFLYSIKGRVPGLNQQIGNSPDIDKATAFATSSLVKHLYYAVENKIYVYDILANSSRLVYSFPSDCRIADLEMFRSTSKRLVVAINKGANGELYYFDIDNIGNFIGGTYTKKFDGFGEIVHLNYRKAQ